MSRPASGKSAASANASAHDSLETVAAKSDRRGDPDCGEHRLLKADRSAAPRGARELGRCRERETVPAPSTVRPRQRAPGRAATAGRPTSSAVTSSEAAIARPDASERPDASPSRSDHRPEPMRSADGETPARRRRRARLRARRDRARRGGRARRSRSARPARRGRCRFRSETRQSRPSRSVRATESASTSVVVLASRARG